MDMRTDGPLRKSSKPLKMKGCSGCSGTEITFTCSHRSMMKISLVPDVIEYYRDADALELHIDLQPETPSKSRTTCKGKRSRTDMSYGYVPKGGGFPRRPSLYVGQGAPDFIPELSSGKSRCRSQAAGELLYYRSTHPIFPRTSRISSPENQTA